MSMSPVQGASRFTARGRTWFNRALVDPPSPPERPPMPDPARPLLIRPLAPEDEPDWRRLWAGYLAFYREILAPAVTESTWRRMLDPATRDMIGRVAVVDGRLAGILHATIHANTWSAAPVCYLEDLYVDADRRRHGVGRALIAALAEEGRQAGWRRIYWRTGTDNVTAQALYDDVARRSGWITYELDLVDAEAPARGAPVAARPRGFNPPAIHPPNSRYSHGVVWSEAPGMRRLVISGQVGIRPDRSVPDDLGLQIEQAYDNLFAVLAEARMTPQDIVKLTTFVTDRSPETVRLVREIRGRRLGDHAPASTFLVVAGLASPAFSVEIEAEAVAGS
jgi:enamine deaminase RidA (YjgF/YER057c/UK114 family)/GNAT superfamily N-acetyltransferase